MKIAFISFGCKVNKAETDALIGMLAAHGGIYEPEPANADVVIINTCAVTEKAQNDGVKYIKGLKQKNPQLKLAATGCLAELLKDGLDADYVIANADKMNTLNVIFSTTPSVAKSACHSFASEEDLPRIHTRAFLKVQDGCNCHCAYCIIPQLRGEPSSKPIESVIAEAKAMIAAGYKEIVISGIHLGLYDDPDFVSLLKALCALKGDFRLRLSSLYVNEITPDFIKTVADEPKICPHFHISLQSGADEILAAMGRKYRAGDFVNVVKQIREAIPNAGIGADLIVGYPGESEALFAETMQLLDAVKLDYLHVFPFSKRPGTAAATAADQVDNTAKLKRAKLARAKAAEHKQAAAEALVGSRMKVLCEKDGHGHSESFWLVKLGEGSNQKNEFVELTISKAKDGLLFG